jgi:hypothetical protein
MTAPAGAAHNADELQPTAAIWAAPSIVQSHTLGRTANRKAYA